MTTTTANSPIRTEPWQDKLYSGGWADGRGHNLARLLHRDGRHLDAAVYWRRYLALDDTSEWAAFAKRALKFCEIQIAHS